MQRFLAPLGLPLEWGVTDLVPGRRLDAAYRAGLVAFEYDGRDHHVLPTDRDADGLRAWKRPRATSSSSASPPA